MNDPIKKFVEQHREAFDHMEPPAAVLEQIKNRLKAKAEEENKANLKKTEERKIVPLFSRAKWAVAASIMLAVITTYFFYNNKGNDSDLDKIAQQKEQGKSFKAIEKTAEPVNEVAENQRVESDQRTALNQNVTTGQNVAPNQNALANQRSSENQNVPQKNQVAKKSIEPSVQLDMATKELYARLNDSTSSTVRLSAILEIDKTNSINKTTLNSLAKTLNNDSNSNVRLAALEVMGQYANNKHVSSLLVNSFSTQNDPLVQLGLIGLIGKIDNVKVEDRLFALADDPNTLGAVKDEAYLALLNQNKL